MEFLTKCIKEESESTFREQSSLYNSFINAPSGIAVVKGKTHIFVFANAVFEKIVAKKVIIGKPIRDHFPEIEQQELWQYLDHAFATGEPFIANELPVDLKGSEDGILERHYLNIVIQPLTDGEGNIESLVLHVIDVRTQVEAQKQISVREDKFQNLITQAPVFIVILNGSTFIVETINKIALDIWGKSYEDVFNRPLFESSPEIEGVFKPIFDHVYTSGELFADKEITVQLKRFGKPDTAYFDMVYQPLRNIDNKIYGIIAIGTETTEAVKARKVIEASALFSRTILESSPDCIKVLDVEGGIQYMNYNALCQLEIEDFSTVKNKKWWTLWGCEQEALVKESIDKALKGETTKFTAVNSTFKGTPKWWDVVVSPVVKPGEPVQQIIAVSRDITQQKEYELQIKISEEKFRGLFETMDQGLSIVEMIYDEKNKPIDFRYLETNPVFNKQSGLPDVLNKTIKELVPDIEDFWIETYGKVSLTGEPIRFTQEAKTMNSWFDVNAFRLGEKGSKKVAILFTNITKQKKSEETLHKIAFDLKLATDSASVGIWSLDVKTDKLAWSDLHKRMWGYNEHRTDLTFEDWHKIILEEDKGLALKRVEDARISHTPYEVEYRIKRPNDNGIRWMKAVGQYYYNQAGEAETLTGISLDITQQKEAEEKRKASENQFHTFADTIQNLAWIANKDGERYWYNQRCEYTGNTLEEMKGWDWEKVHHPDHINEVKAFLKEAWEKGQAWELTFPLRRHDGKYRWFLTRAYPVKDTNGNIERWIGTNTDISEQKSFSEELEKKVNERTEELSFRTKQLEEINKTLDENNIALGYANAELKSFSYVASHDLQEPLRMIKRFSQRIIEAKEFSDKTQEYFNFIITASERMRNLINSLIDYSRIDKNELHFVPCNLNNIVEESKRDLQLRIVKNQAMVEYEMLPTINGIYIQISQLFTNIIGNAIKYCQPEIIPHINITSEHINGQEISHLGANKQLEYYAIKIADNGIGFKEEFATKIFEAFKRLHGSGEYTGTGIGLSIVKKIVTNHNGFIVAEGKPGIGSTFTLYLPTT